MIKDLINISSDFQTSINIGFDLYNEDKIRNFIPTSAFLDIFSSIFKSTYITSNDRAKILSGAYGRGKSHIILVTLALICGLNKDKKTFSKILAYFRKQNIELYKQVESFLKNQRKFFPVVINGNSSSLSQAFLNGLETSLKLADLNDLIPETGFHTVLRTIDNWKNNYKATYNQLKNNVDNINDFLISLRNYEISSYKKFVELYPKLTSGSIFNAFNGADVVSLYENIANKIVEKGYEGIIVIYDEFSKYLESNIVNTEISDIKLLQDFAEKCNRSGKIQLHLILICHKDIENYIDSKLPKERIDGWRGVSGRFSHIDFQSDYNQTYEIISSVLDKTNKYEAFKENYKSIFNRIVEDYLNCGLFDNERILESVVYDCFPLQPDTTFVLPVLSEKIAQNERTLFTFLASDSHNSISDFLRTCKENFKLVTLDYVYDYFEPLLRKEAFNTEIYKLYNLSQKLINKFECKSSLEVKIIKSICLIYVIERFDKIKPLWESIIRIYKQSYDSDFIDSMLKRLIEEDCLVYQKRSNGFLKLKETSGVNIQEEINNTLATINERINIADTLNNINFDSFIYPNKYNEEHEMTRFFEFKFIESQELKNNLDSISDSNCSDGYMFGIIPSNRYEIEELQKTVKNISLNYKDSIFVAPNSYYEITQTVK